VKANKWAKEHSDLIEFEKALRIQRDKGEEDINMENKVQKKQMINRKRRLKQNHQATSSTSRHQHHTQDHDDSDDEEAHYRGSERNETSNPRTKSQSRQTVTRPTRSTRQG
jgi:hypothetical protein